MDPSAELTLRAQARVGHVLNAKWRLDALIGVGGMAAVYAATGASGGRGAVKLLHPEISLDGAAKQRFLREGYVANTVRHPGAVAVLDSDTAEDGAVYLVMELLLGETLETRMARLEKLPVAEVAWIADQVLDVLHAAHQQGIVHRDVKPENLFLTHEGVVKVLDFGIARVREERGSIKATRTGTTVGTPAYMPPEQALGKKDLIDARSDVWAVGATLFDLITGRTVHVGDTVNQLLLAAMTKPAQPIREVAPHVPPAIAAVIDRALAFDQAARFADARAMQLAPRAGVANAEPVPRPADPASSYGLTMPLDLDALRPPTPIASGAPSRPTEVLPTPTRPATSATASPVSRDHAPPPTSPRSAGRAAILVPAALAGVALLAVIGWLAIGRAPQPVGPAAGGPSASAEVTPTAATPAPSVAAAAPTIATAEPTTEATAEPAPTAASANAGAGPKPRAPTVGKPGRPTSRPPSKKEVLDRW